MTRSKWLFPVLAIALAAAPASAERTPPPIYDFCDEVVVVVADDHGQVAYAGVTCDGSNQVLDHDCSGFVTHNGHEDYYAVAMDPGCTFSATVSHQGDAVLMVSAECMVYGTMFTCLAAVDAEGPGGVETITYTNDTGAAATVYLVVDTPDGACGAYDMSLQTDCTVAGERASLGAVKAAFR